MLKRTVKFLIACLCIFLIVRYFSGAQDELNLIKEFRLTELTYLVLLNLIAYIFYALSILVLLLHLGLKGVSFLKWFNIFIISRFINFHIIQGANIYRSITLKRDFDFPYTNYISSVGFLTWFTTVSTFLFCSLTIQFFNPALAINQISLLSASWALTIFSMILPFVLTKIKLRSSHWIIEKCNELIICFRSCLKNFPLLILLTLISLLHFALTIMMIELGFRAMHFAFSIDQIALFTVILTLSKYINIVPNNIGVTEYLSGALSHALGVNLGAGILLSGILRVIEYIFVCVLGVILLKSIKIQAKVKELEEGAPQEG